MNLEKRVRIQANTTEQMMTFVPAMWMFAHYIHIEAAVALGVSFIIGRQVFAWGYMQEDGAKRAPGFLITFLAGVITVLGALGGAIYKLAA
ncbi:MAG: glutathione S-transferase [Pseudoalteromonas tetraodonis]